ncbi:hypothetical protein BDP27DRAFT_295991 [Rhodocollybia butyracea]|uniref:Peptidase S8/S53 domain-containing protein n=1 Tax=Rhodocollybia butyracea TaxID=206335 RepID=A0A9P5PF52_9AGAR|nr:hypothetical protein BDP27DRAFT_295991 [Rhodocollybia butyracea]
MLDFTWNYDPNWGQGILVYVLDSGIQQPLDLDFRPGQVLPPGIAVSRIRGQPTGNPLEDEGNHGTGVASVIAGKRFGLPERQV